MSTLFRAFQSIGNFESVARVISNVISPPLVFAVLGFTLAISALPLLGGLIWGSIYGFFVSLVPILVVIYMYKTDRVEDLHISDIRQRRIPYLVSVSGALITYLLVGWFDGPQNIGFLALSNVIGLSLLGIINNIWLISNHMASITSAVLIAGLEFGVVVGLILSPLIVLVFFARCILHRHTYAQLFAGTFIGLGVILFMVQVGLP